MWRRAERGATAEALAEALCSKTSKRLYYFIYKDIVVIVDGTG